MSKAKHRDNLAPLPEHVLARIARDLVRRGMMPSPGKLADALAAGTAVQHPGPRRLSRSSGGEPYHRVFVSASNREASTLHHAKAGMQTPEFHNLIMMSNRMPGTDGGDNGYGVWHDGTEESRVVRVNDPARIDEVAARLGKTFGQKGVIRFASDPSGSDIAHVFTVPGTDVAKIAAALDEHGIEHKTLVPDHERKQTEVHVLDVGGSLADNANSFARAYGAAHDQHLGRARFIPSEAYDRILARTAGPG